MAEKDLVDQSPEPTIPNNNRPKRGKALISVVAYSFNPNDSTIGHIVYATRKEGQNLIGIGWKKVKVHSLGLN